MRSNVGRVLILNDPPARCGIWRKLSAMEIPSTPGLLSTWQEGHRQQPLEPRLEHGVGRQGESLVLPYTRGSVSLFLGAWLTGYPQGECSSDTRNRTCGGGGGDSTWVECLFSTPPLPGATTRAAGTARPLPPRGTSTASRRAPAGAENRTRSRLLATSCDVV
jgi:hypothetical protein